MGLSVLNPPVPGRISAQASVPVTQLDLWRSMKLNLSLRATWKDSLKAYITLTHSSSKQGNSYKFLGEKNKVEKKKRKSRKSAMLF